MNIGVNTKEDYDQISYILKEHVENYSLYHS